MTYYQWPIIDVNCPRDIPRHASCLKSDFDLVSNTADISLSHRAVLPSTLEPKISIGIKKGVADGRSKGYCPKWSKINERRFRKVMLKNITTEAAFQARDRIPLDQFNGLRKSYNALHAKLVAQMPPTATTHQSVDTGVATQTTSTSGLVESSQKTGSATESIQASQRPVISRHEERAKNVKIEESEDDSSEDESSEEEENEKEESNKEESNKEKSKQGERKGDHAEDCEVANSKDSGSRSESSDSEGGSSCHSSLGCEEESEDDSQSDSDADSDDGQDQDTVKEELVCNAVAGMSDPPTTFKLEIKEQASINRLEDMESSEILESLSASLQDTLREKQLCSRTFHICAASVLDSGDVNVAIRAETREALPMFLDLRGWNQSFERTLISSPVPTYRVIAHLVNTNSLIFRNRKEKSKIIRKLTESNQANGDGDGINPIIRDIFWASNSSKARPSLIVEFVDSRQANAVLIRGLCWQEMRHGCERADKEYRVVRCGKCQAYGHLSAKCIAPYQCGKCAGEHSTRICGSEAVKCASCGGGHYAGNNRCPEKVKARKDLQFKDENMSQATKNSAAETKRTPSSDAQHPISARRTETEASIPSPISMGAGSADDEVDPESQQPLPESEPTKDTSLDLATVRRLLEDMKKQVIALDSALQSKAPGGTKRRIDESFPSGVEAEPSNMAAKRVKKEEPTEEDSMSLYRQPSIYSEY